MDILERVAARVREDARKALSDRIDAIVAKFSHDIGDLAMSKDDPLGLRVGRVETNLEFQGKKCCAVEVINVLRSDLYMALVQKAADDAESSLVQRLHKVLTEEQEGRG